MSTRASERSSILTTGAAIPSSTPRYSRLQCTWWRMIRLKMKALLLSAAAFSLCTPSPRCVAQEVVPIIYLSTGEAAKAKQTAQDLTSAQERNDRAATAWRNFHQSYQAAHPELPGLRFASDFRVAFARKTLSKRFALEEAATVELSTEERQKAESLHRELLEAKRALDQAQKSWSDYWQQLVIDHVSPSPSGGAIVTLPNGKSATIPAPWATGVLFTPDFRIAVPQIAVRQ